MYLVDCATAQCQKCGYTKLANIGASNQSVTCTIKFAVHTNYVTQIRQGQNISTSN